MGFNSAFKGLTTSAISSYIKFSSYRTENILAAIKVSRVTIFREIIIIWYNNQRKRINEWAKCYVFFCLSRWCIYLPEGWIWIIFAAPRTCDLTQSVIRLVIHAPVSPHRLYKIHHIDSWRRHGEVRAGSVHFSVRQHPHDASPLSTCQKLSVQIMTWHSVVWPSNRQNRAKVRHK